MAKIVEAVKTFEILVNLVITGTSTEHIRAVTDARERAVIGCETKTGVGPEGRGGMKSTLEGIAAPRLVQAECGRLDQVFLGKRMDKQIIVMRHIFQECLN